MFLFSFLNPFALFGLLASTLPLVIHLLSRWRTRELEFSSLMLLRRVQNRNVRRLHTRQWLLLLLRTLIIALLMLIPARPTVRGLLESGPRDHLPVEAVLVADVSASTRYVDSQGRISDLLGARAGQLVSWLRPADRYRLISAGDRMSGTSSGWQSYSGDAAGVREITGAISPGYGPNALAGALESASSQFSDDESFRREVYLFTDRQRGFLGADSLAVDSSLAIDYYLVDVHGEPLHNVAVQSIGFPGELLRPGAPLEVTLDLARFGGDSLLPLFPRIYLDSRLVGQGETSLEPDSRQSVVVEIPPLEPGFHELSAEIDADGLAADNRRSCVVLVPPVSKVLLVERRINTGPDYLGAALEVLSSRRAGAIALRRSPSLPASPSELDGADVVIVHGLEHPAARISAFLTEIRRQGCHALFIPRDGENVTGAFATAAGRLELPIAPGAVTKFGKDGFDLPQRARIAGGGDLFDRLFDGIDGLARARLFALRDIPPAAEVASVWDLKTRGGRVWLRMVRGGESNLMLSATDLASADETELPGTPLFVPLVHSLVSMLSWTGPLVQQAAAVGEDITVYFGGLVNTAGMELHGPGGVRYYLPPVERRSWMFDKADEPGAYWLYRDGELCGGFAVGLDPDESDIRLESDSRIDEAFFGLRLHRVPAGSDPDDYVLLGRGGVEIWPWLLIMALVLLGVEQVVANRRRKEEEL